MGNMFFIILGVVLWTILALWPAWLAKRKGYSFILFFLIALVISWLIALIIAVVLKDKNVNPEDAAASKAAEKALDAEENS